MTSPSLTVPTSLWAGYQRQQSLCRVRAAQPYPAGTSLTVSLRRNFHIWTASYSLSLLYAVQHCHTVLIDWWFSLAEQHLSRISTGFLLKKKKKKKTGLTGFPVFPYLVISCGAVICFWAQTQVFWTGVCVRVFLPSKAESTKAAFGTPRVLSCGSWGHDTGFFSFVLAQGNPCYTHTTPRWSQSRMCNPERKKAVSTN